MLPFREFTTWIWTLSAVLLAIGLFGIEAALIAAILVSLAQIIVFAIRLRSVSAFPVQIRVAYTLLLLFCFHPLFRWLYWLPTLGTSALILFNYCLLARVLSLMPWNRDRSRPLTRRLLWKTFFTPPVATDNPDRPINAAGGDQSVCSLERHAADR